MRPRFVEIALVCSVVVSFENITESKRRGVLLEVVWNSLDRRTRNLEKLDALKVAMNGNKTSLNKITLIKGLQQILITFVLLNVNIYTS